MRNGLKVLLNGQKLPHPVSFWSDEFHRFGSLELSHLIDIVQCHSQNCNTDIARPQSGDDETRPKGSGFVRQSQVFYEQPQLSCFALAS
jgi:hypothetical protein